MDIRKELAEISAERRRTLATLKGALDAALGDLERIDQALVELGAGLEDRERLTWEGSRAHHRREIEAVRSLRDEMP